MWGMGGNGGNVVNGRECGQWGGMWLMGGNVRECGQCGTMGGNVVNGRECG